MSTWILRLDADGVGPRLAVKDLIDMKDVPTTAGCRAVAESATPAAADAACLAGARAAGARIVGRTNLHELALGVTGINPWFGTPVNPLDPRRVPGGSSSGSAVAVATGEADVAYGSDTGGSIRIPAACCGITGLKTTWGRVPLAGVWPLSPTFDTVGPLARDVTGVIAGMSLLEPGFRVPATATAATGATTVGRLRLDADPAIDAAVDRALAATGWHVVDIVLPGWERATSAAALLLVAEAWDTDGEFVTRHPDQVGSDVVARLHLGRDASEAALASARAFRPVWASELAAAFARVDLIATPTLTIFPPVMERAEDLLTGRCTLPINLAGGPALSVPVASAGPLPASLQLIAAHHDEERLLAAGLVVERAAGA